MELTLNRQDLVQISATCRKTMLLLPSAKKRQQKVVVGDDTGSVLCFGMRRYEQEQVFKTPSTGKEVSRIELGGVGEERDRIFWASGSTIRASTKKGKEYLKFNTNVTETIRSMYVGDEDIHTGGDYIYNQFVSCKDTGACTQCLGDGRRRGACSGRGPPRAPTPDGWRAALQASTWRPTGSTT